MPGMNAVVQKLREKLPQTVVTGKRTCGRRAYG